MQLKKKVNTKIKSYLNKVRRKVLYDPTGCNWNLRDTLGEWGGAAALAVALTSDEQQSGWMDVTTPGVSALQMEILFRVVKQHWYFVKQRHQKTEYNQAAQISSTPLKY